MKRKLLAILLSVLLLAVCVPLEAIPVAAATSGTTGDCTWTLDGTHLTISGNGKMEDYDPWNNYAPWGEYINSITIENGVTSIGSYAFHGCISLTSATILDSVTTINEGAFSGSSLTSVTIPDSVITIGDFAFEHCLSLSSVTIGAGVTTIGKFVFYWCDSLTAIDTDVNNPNYSSLEGVLFNKEQTILIQFPGGKSGAYIIPDGVTAIGDYAFSYCDDFTTVSIPDSVTTIGDHAFSECDSLASVTIPDSVTAIGAGAFYWCPSLTSVIVEDGLTSISDYAFSSCVSLATVTIPNTITSIGEGAFYWCDPLSDVYYAGSETDRTNIDIRYDNNDLLNATWHYNYGGEPEVTYGDPNGDGKINNKDLGLLQQHLADWEVELNLDACDVNKDGKVNNKDLGLLQQYLADWDVVLG